jgi:hypothetical protein
MPTIGLAMVFQHPHSIVWQNRLICRPSRSPSNCLQGPLDPIPRAAGSMTLGVHCDRDNLMMAMAGLPAVARPKLL